MSMNELVTLQQLPTTDAVVLFTCRHCKISAIAARTFVDTPNILTLDLAYNELKSSALFPEVFKGPESDEEYAPIKLQKLDLSHNKITSLDKLLFEHTPNLKFLDLSYNVIHIDDESTQMAFNLLHVLEVRKKIPLSDSFTDQISFQGFRFKLHTFGWFATCHSRRQRKGQRTFTSGQQLCYGSRWFFGCWRIFRVSLLK